MQPKVERRKGAPRLGALCQTGGRLTVRGANHQVAATLTRMGLASLTGITPPEPPSTL
ncbi:hypothetical protein [Streptomyces sirii]|uniref:hypothetical protein n=1 Tax=Streptomyces sirii TaxID=3127701 RepID=UPI003D360C46